MGVNNKSWVVINIHVIKASPWSAGGVLRSLGAMLEGKTNKRVLPPRPPSLPGRARGVPTTSQPQGQAPVCLPHRSAPST